MGDPRGVDHAARAPARIRLARAGVAGIAADVALRAVGRALSARRGPWLAHECLHVVFRPRDMPVTILYERPGFGRST